MRRSVDARVRATLPTPLPAPRIARPDRGIRDVHSAAR
jgi:hypothetical protein